MISDEIVTTKDIPQLPMSSYHCMNRLEKTNRYVQECIDSTFVSSVGQFVDRFEASLAGIRGLCTR